MASIEKRYAVINVKSLGNRVELALKEFRESEERYYSSEEEEVARSVARATAQVFRAMGLPIELDRTPELPDVIISLSMEEFQDLGRPSVGDVFIFKITRLESPLSYVTG